VKITPYTGVAVGDNLRCERNVPCDRVGHMEISVDATKLPSGRRTATVTVQVLGSNEKLEIKVDATQVMRLGIPGVTRH
jgi:hypothetical protein